MKRALRIVVPGLIGMVLLISACGRPFIDPDPPKIEILEPDFSTVFTNSQATLRLRATSFREVSRLELGDTPMSYNETQDVWEGDLQFKRGLNEIVVTSYDANEFPGQDTLRAIFMPFRIVPADFSLAVPLGGHTALKLSDDDLLVIGGAPATGAPAQPEAYLLSEGETQFQQIPQTLNVARTGHTATLLPDGRVLILGGSTRDRVTAVEELVEQVEIYDPVQQTFSMIPVQGAPIRRTLHTTILRVSSSIPVLDLLGGEGDTQYTPSSRLGIRQDLRSFFLSNDTLFALSPAPGPFIRAVAGHTQTQLTLGDVTESGRYLVSTSLFTPDTTRVSFILDYRGNLGIFEEPARPPLVARVRHTSALLRNGYVAFFGGYRGTPDQVLDASELYVDQARRYYRLPEGPNLVTTKRFGQAATMWTGERILLLGGFAPDGNGSTTAEYFRFDI